MTGRERHLLLVAAQECSLRGLLQGAKWAAELAAELPVMDSDGDLPVVQYTADFVAELGSFTMAKAYFDLHEYDRAAHALRSCSSQRAVFLRCYSQYLAGEKRKENERVDLLGTPLAANSEQSCPRLVGSLFVDPPHPCLLARKNRADFTTYLRPLITTSPRVPLAPQVLPVTTWSQPTPIWRPFAASYRC